MPISKKRKPADPGRDMQRQVAHRWTARLAAARWTPVSDYFLKNYHRMKITHTEAMVLIHLISFKWDLSAPFPALGTIAKRMGITPTSVRTHLRRLEGKGFLYRQMKVGTTNRFHFDGLFNALEKMMDADKATEEEADDLNLVHA